MQHLEKNFEQGYADWLNRACKLHVRLAIPDDKPMAGEVIVPPVGVHLVCENKMLQYDDGPTVLNQKPSVDRLFQTAAASYRQNVLGVQLTGMGKDGAIGCKSIIAEGGFTIVQDEESSVVFGMPKAAIDIAAASVVLPYDEIAGYLCDLLGLKND